MQTSHDEVKDDEAYALLVCRSTTSQVARMLCHSKSRKYENYIVNGIWHRLRADQKLRKAGVGVRFVTRKSVSIDDAGRRLCIAMYFPSVNIAVDCREDLNTKQTIADRKEQAAIMRKLKIVPGDYFRVNAAASLEEIDRMIDRIVARISVKALANKKKVQDDWWLASGLLAK